MKAFSPAGMADKAYFGRGARTFGNPDGATSGGGAYAAGGDNPNGPNQGGGGTPPSVLNLTITSDHIDTGAVNGAGLFFSDLLTPQQHADWVAGNITTCNIAAAGSPPNGYWTIAGAAPAPPIIDPINSEPGEDGLVFDLQPGTAVTVNLNTSRLRIYGGGGGGGGSQGLVFVNGGNGGSAITLQGVTTIVLNISNTDGVNTGRIFGGGGGGGAGSGNGGNPAFPCGGGGGAAGWFAGLGGFATNATAHASGNDGGVYDPANGGSGDPDVAGGTGGQIGGTGGGAGGGLGAPSPGGGSGGPGLGGFAVQRMGTPGATTILSGGGSNFIRGTVQ